MPSRVRELNGYRLIYQPDHPRAIHGRTWGGYVYEHILVVEESLGRPMLRSEVCHHLDGNRSNNLISNLLVLERGQHAKLHLWLSGAAPQECDVKNGVKSGKAKVTEPSLCHCGRTLQNKHKKYCSSSCANLARRKFIWPTKEQLAADINNMSMLAVGRKYGVSDGSIRKLAKRYGLLGQS